MLSVLVRRSMSSFVDRARWFILASRRTRQPQANRANSDTADEFTKPTFFSRDRPLNISGSGWCWTIRRQDHNFLDTSSAFSRWSPLFTYHSYL